MGKKKTAKTHDKNTAYQIDGKVIYKSGYIPIPSQSELEAEGLWEKFKDRPAEVLWEKFKDLPAVSWEALKKVMLNPELGTEKELNKIKDLLTSYEQEHNLKNSDILSFSESILIVYSIYNTTAKAEEIIKDVLPEELSKYIPSLNSQLSYNFRATFAAGLLSGDSWPEADISGSKVKGRVLLRPDNISPVANEEVLLDLKKIMRDKVKDLAKNGDLAVDILDIVIAKHLKTTNNPYEPVKITADDFLQARGIKKVLSSGTGRRGGYREEWRQEIAKYIYILSDAFLEVAEMEVYEYDSKGKRQRVCKKNLHSRAVVLSSLETQSKINEGPDILAWYVRPGDCFIPALTDPGYQTALLSQKALHYDYNKYKYEKRLARYFTYLWRMRKPKERLKVSTLLEEAILEINESRPGRTKDRLEKALNRLQKDKVITAWEYENLDKKLTAKRKWWQQWLNNIVVIKPPKEVLEHYERIKRPGE